jgi:hypothetical protein
MIVGSGVRDWIEAPGDALIFPYDAKRRPISTDMSSPLFRYLWLYRVVLSNSKMFGGKTKVECGLHWFEYGRLTSSKLQTPFFVVFANIATHNHFVLDRGGKLFDTTAPIIKLLNDATEDDHLALVGLLNSSTACYWIKQRFQTKGSSGMGRGIYDERWEFFYQVSGTGMEAFPVCERKPLTVARQLDTLAREYVALFTASMMRTATPTFQRLAQARKQAGAIRGKMIALQEELDWQCYQLYGLLSDDLRYRDDDLPELAFGERAFEIVMARQMANGELQTTWFERHGSKPITDLPRQWPAAYRTFVERRIKMIETNKEIGLIERPEHKRRWNTEPWEEQEQRALKNWLLDRMEDKRYWPRIELQSTAQVADRASADAVFMQVAALYRGRPDFDLAALVAELVEGESVPFLPILRYKAPGLRKREVWERTWDLQRQDDERAKQRQALEEKLKRIRTRTEKNFESEYATLKKMEVDLKKETIKVRDRIAPHVKLEDEWNGSRSFLALQSEELDGEGGRAVKTLGKAKKEVLDFHTSIAKKIDQALAKDDEYQAALTELDGIPDDPEIPVPPKYATTDFQKTDYWRLRGKLDVPKERWLSYPHCQSVSDPSLVVGWAGWNHLEQATALVTYYDARKREGWDAKRLTPLLAGLQQLLPWIHQWHPEIDKEFGETAGKSYQSMLEQDAHELGLTLEDIRTWQPPETTARRRTRK